MRSHLHRSIRHLLLRPQTLLPRHRTDKCRSTGTRTEKVISKKYFIYRGITPNPTTVIDSTSVLDDTLETYAGLTNYTTYYFRIAAKDTNGNVSGYSNEVASTPFDQTAPAAPQNLSFFQADSYIQLQWDVAVKTDLKRYHIYQGASTDPTTLIDSTNGLGNTEEHHRSEFRYLSLPGDSEGFERQHQCIFEQCFRCCVGSHASVLADRFDRYGI